MRLIAEGGEKRRRLVSSRFCVSKKAISIIESLSFVLRLNKPKFLSEDPESCERIVEGWICSGLACWIKQN
uniref:Uncharacterized protein n=1 Tax=Salix viminalis TaxID=40686 RepID=A0A6N2KN75_SALVM